MQPPNTRAGTAVAVLGAGSWGTSLAVVLARNGCDVSLWGHDAARLALLAHERCNARYLPGVKFPANLTIEPDLRALAQTHENFLIVVPSSAFRATLTALVQYMPAHARVAWATKGLEPGTTRLLSAVADETLGGRASAVVSGPTFAREVAHGLPTALTVAARDAQHADTVAQWLRNDHLRVYTNSDVVGVEVGGAIKNVMAIAAGISDGLGYGANARAALITRGLAEMTRVGVRLGGNKETFMGLTGMGDLILTCTDDQSRNRQVGLGLGRGETLAHITARLGQVAEGIATAGEVYRLAQRLAVEMPITTQVYRVLNEGLAAPAAVQVLLRREAKSE